MKIKAFAVKRAMPLIVVFLACISYCRPLAAQTSLQDFLSGNINNAASTTREGVSGGRLVSLGAGWVIANGRLLWTHDNGVVWTDITPPQVPAEDLAPFFVDATHGWIVFNDRLPSGERAGMHIIRTVDGGRTWSSLPFDRTAYAGLKTESIYGRDLAFVDPEHGWFLWGLERSNVYDFGGVLLSTSDGGATWTQLPEPPSGIGFRFHTPRDGWMRTFHELWATHDGGKTWQQQTAPPPTNCSECEPHYNLPESENLSEALMVVTFSDNSADRSIDCTYATRVGEGSWRPTEECGQTTENPPVDFVVRANMHTLRPSVDEHLFFPEEPAAPPMPTAAAPMPTAAAPMATEGGAVLSGFATLNMGGPGPRPPRGSITGAYFVDELNGWLWYHGEICTKIRDPNSITLEERNKRPLALCLESVQRTELLATSDGGKTFTVITPPAGDTIPKPIAVPVPPSAAPPVPTR